MSLLDLIFPKKCFGCGQEGSYICPLCQEKLKIASPICPVCTRPSGQGFTHPRCSYELSPDGLTSIWEYEGGIRRAILSLKYKFAYEVSQKIAELVVEKLKKKKVFLPVRPVLIPVPLHRQRQNELKRKERVENVKGTFLINKKYRPLRPRPLLLFDDVWTTGSTIREAAKTLKKAGAREVWGLTITKGH
ncbi:MAG: Amidophosphoribosyltransferase-like protein [Candidatus Amesbacteria bacterium GW2011_GWA2_47_11b]|uniref:Amidophosphoribosyltransferase-like protein n=1 Tax=Candidatus Amesbacteria bacterium GW2011_GWA2_47_11b TaxID=1618358 RepID=A0A0G1UIG2_9BACT|nr:MAG: Amidophosphoribosyltransferase-like protein [Candidatus Amesbacteria bacterium GW2011_GWA2_47_11b]